MCATLLKKRTDGAVEAGKRYDKVYQVYSHPISKTIET